jgi:hypothetical protein
MPRPVKGEVRVALAQSDRNGHRAVSFDGRKILRVRFIDGQEYPENVLAGASGEAGKEGQFRVSQPVEGRPDEKSEPDILQSGIEDVRPQD